MPTITPQALPGLRSQLAPILHLFDNPDCSDIMINAGGAAVFAEIDGVMLHQPHVQFEEQTVRSIITWIASINGQAVDADHPLLTARITNDQHVVIARVAAALPPCSVTGPMIDIRLFPRLRPLSELLAREMVTVDQAGVIQHAIADRRNILVAGGTGAGKSTVTAMIVSEFPPDDRVIIIEDTAEIQAHNRNLVRLEALQPIEGDAAFAIGHQEIPIRALVTLAYRLRPDRIVIGEVRGPEAYDLLQSLNSGHRGSVSTIHANSAPDALARLADCALEANVGWSETTATARVHDAIDLVIFVERHHGRRRVADLYVPPGKESR